MELGNIHKGHRVSRWWLSLWRIGGAAVLVALGAGFARQALAEPAIVHSDPGSYLQCAGSAYSVTEPVYDEPVGGPTPAYGPAQIVDGIAVVRARAGHSEPAQHGLLFESDTRSDYGFTAADGRTTMVISMANDPRAGWIVEAIYECA